MKGKFQSVNTQQVHIIICNESFVDTNSVKLTEINNIYESTFIMHFMKALSKSFYDLCIIVIYGHDVVL